MNSGVPHRLALCSSVEDVQPGGIPPSLAELTYAFCVLWSNPLTVTERKSDRLVYTIIKRVFVRRACHIVKSAKEFFDNSTASNIITHSFLSMLSTSSDVSAITTLPCVGS